TMFMEDLDILDAFNSSRGQRGLGIPPPAPHYESDFNYDVSRYSEASNNFYDQFSAFGSDAFKDTLRSWRPPVPQPMVRRNPAVLHPHYPPGLHPLSRGVPSMLQPQYTPIETDPRRNVDCKIDNFGASKRKAPLDEGEMTQAKEKKAGSGWSYNAMIALALKNRPSGQMPVLEMYLFLMNRFPFLRTMSENWKNSIRHNLSVSKNYEKVEVSEKRHIGRQKNVWRIVPGCEKNIDAIIKKAEMKAMN
ncbi:hypothetical protein PFISCL1PPCAC_6550, partial [Pristionchus fissidentatus]